MKNWHLLMTKPREDERAAENLLNQDYELFRPLLKHYKHKKGQQVAITEALFPRYIFIRLDEEFSHWSQIRSTRGVQGLVRFTEYPVIVPEQMITEIKSLLKEDGILDRTETHKVLFRPGDKVEIISGSFKGLQAVVKEQDRSTRVILLLEMLGKTQALKIPLDQIKKSG